MDKFMIFVTKDEKKVMGKRLKKHNLKFLEELPVDRVTLLACCGIIIRDDEVDKLKEISIYMVEGEMENWESYVNDPENDVARYSIMNYYDNEEES